ncbi:MAG: DUF4160 domain-containing protein [Pseudomonadales bacterium]|nr:DUF4160 domain-containing protein [Pseudomonadales bacterium]
MPTVLRTGPYRFYFYSSDQDEPRHVHVQRDDAIAKYWLEPTKLASSQGFRPSELNRIRSIIVESHSHLIEAWDEFFGG